MPSLDPDPLNDNRICFECVDEAYLKDLIRQEGTVDECSYCGEDRATISIEELANHVERAFEDHFDRTSPDPEGWEISMLSDREFDYNWERSGEPAKWAISTALEVEEGIADDVLSVLTDRHYDHYRVEVSEECEFSEESHYRERLVGDGKFRYLWNEFERILKTESRHFSRAAQSILDQIFDGITDLRTIRGSQVVVTAGPSRKLKSLYRGRVFPGAPEELEEALKRPWSELGTPPSNLAGAGRMNARGIAVFYGAQNAKTALAEVRPPVGSQVAVARFDLTRDLRLLDLKALKSVAAGGSIFDPEMIGEMEKANFLEILSQLMSRAIMPHEEVSEYLPTQAVAEYLANEVGLDGMIFSSVQAGQTASNVVLFHHASRVEEVPIPPGIQIEALVESTDSGDVQPQYYVWECLPAHLPKSRPEPTPGPLVLDFSDHTQYDDRDDSLRIDLSSIQVIHINAVQFRYKAYQVLRDTFEEPNLNLSESDNPE